MFSKIEKTNHPPLEIPVMVWDGECGFCRYWITSWSQKTKDRIVFKTYQEVAGIFPDIPLKEFKKASRLIEPDGSIYSGPDSAFRVFTYFEKQNNFWHNLYTKHTWFKSLSNNAYNFIAKHRSSMFMLTKIFFGNNPKSLSPYWLVGSVVVISLLFLLVKYL